MWKSCLLSHALHTARRPSKWLNYSSTRSVQSSSKPYDVAVIGGGVTGLTAAYRLSQDPNCKGVTLYERSSRLGGWLESEKLKVDGGEVVFEHGPRTLRTGLPSALPMMDLLLSLDLEDQILVTSRQSPAATNRYIYYPDHIVRVPGPDPSRSVLSNIWRDGLSLFTEPALQGLVRALVTEFMKEGRPDAQRNKDEPVADFVTRRLSQGVTDNLVSAVLHGIYAGDVYKLSAQTLLGPYRDLETKDQGVLASLFQLRDEGKKRLEMDTILALRLIARDRPSDHFSRIGKLMKGTSVLTLRDGLGELARRLESALRDKHDKVRILTEIDINAISRNESNSDLTIKYQENDVLQSQTHDRVIATAPAPELAKMIGAGAVEDNRKPARTIDYLKRHKYAVSVMVVNLYYDNPDLVPYRGFGYLIPRSVPIEQNPERGLGVIFGSDSSVGQDTAPGTKLTVMMGGHWWDDWLESDLPDPETATLMACSLLKRHLGITDSPSTTTARFQRDAIPQYTVGHLTRMENLSEAVRDEFNGRLTLAGNWYNMHGIGVLNSITQAYLAASYGVGASRPSFPEQVEKELNQFNFHSWDLEGGIATAPVRYFNASQAAWSSIYSE